MGQEGGAGGDGVRLDHWPHGPREKRNLTRRQATVRWSMALCAPAVLQAERRAGARSAQLATEPLSVTSAIDRHRDPDGSLVRAALEFELGQNVLLKLKIGFRCGLSVH